MAHPVTREVIELAERVEKATGPDRALDADICELVELPLCVEPDCSPGVFRTIINRARNGEEAFGPDEDCPRYTASLAAAMTLAEPFLLVALSDIAADGLTGCCLCSDTSTNPPKEHWGIPTGRGSNRQSLLARAVCAAALRARATPQKDADV